MSMIFFSFRGRTGARQGAGLLREAGISARLDRIPAEIAANGCGFGLWVTPQKAEKAAELLRAGAPYARSFRCDGGNWREVAL